MPHKLSTKSEYSYTSYDSDSTLSTSDKEGSFLDTAHATGTQRVRYQGYSDCWDYGLFVEHTPAIDISLVLPHYRAFNQPVSHRMMMLVQCDAQPVKAKVCRNTVRSKFYLEVRATSSDVTLWLPSDFRGHIRYPSGNKAKFSDGFINHIMPHVRLNEDGFHDDYNGDEVIMHTEGKIYFRMWNTHTNAPECSQKETLKRLFGCGQKTPETTVDWDFLLED